jgi:hypothetical protein
VADREGRAWHGGRDQRLEARSINWQFAFEERPLLRFSYLGNQAMRTNALFRFRRELGRPLDFAACLVSVRAPGFDDVVASSLRAALGPFAGPGGCLGFSGRIGSFDRERVGPLARAPSERGVKEEVWGDANSARDSLDVV